MPPSEIKHVVVLMLENRSFDHMLGMLDHGSLVPVTAEPLPNPLDPSDPKSSTAVAYALTEEGGLDADPKHGYPDVMRQLSGNVGPWQAPYELRNTGFAWNYQERRKAAGRQVLGCHTPALLPVLSTLAREYGVCSRWHCSLPSETWPNRLFAHAATSDDLVENEIRFYDNRTVFEALSSAGHNWQIYAGDIPQVGAYRELHFHDGGFRFSRLGSFFDHARHGRLRKYSFIEPRHFGSSVSSQHPLASIALGERLIRDVYVALASNADIWNSSLLVITYDEHGGFFDRVAPPEAVPPTVGAKDPKYGFAFDLLGPRVPAVVVSSRIAAGTVYDEVLDHTSIGATLREFFDFGETLTDRDRSAADFAGIVTNSEPRAPIELPPAPPITPASQGPQAWAEGVTPEGEIALNEFQQSLVGLAMLIDEERPAPETIDGVQVPPLPEPTFQSETELGEFIEAFRRRHLDQI